ncbi:uncharacterized protein LOC143229088 isoform X2 [Tachypleus tridentatus]|uniref:uncharacterized protein LOC143229088 isoform X2 n=1 Tax=Tachypleus tridentatus TaxID=6853 RepID=UPI003FD62FAF
MTLGAFSRHSLRVNVLFMLCSSRHLLATDVFNIQSFLAELFIVFCVFGHVTVHPLTSTSNDELLFSQQPYAQNLQEPCTGYSFTSDPSLAQIDHVDVLKLAQERVSSLGDVAKEMRTYNMVEDCANLSLPVIYHIPFSVDQLKNISESQVMLLLDELVVNHTAHVYNMKYQQTNSTDSCSNIRPNENSFLGRAEAVVVHLKEVRCFLQLANQVRRHRIETNNSSIKILNERINDVKLCSRRVLRDCQVRALLTHRYFRCFTSFDNPCPIYLN